jgi:cyclophilin family peptidyl-prolyl cis-trans isomerase
MRRIAVALALVVIARADVRAQNLTSADSALVGRILLAEDARDGASPDLAAGLKHRDARVQQLARRAIARIKDPKFAARDSFPALAPAPVYPEPAWRLRYRALTAQSDCGALRTAMVDSAWHVRLRAIDLLAPACGSDTVTLRRLSSAANTIPWTQVRNRLAVSWHASSHALVALARIAPDSARRLLAPHAKSKVSYARAYAARAARVLRDTNQLRALAADTDANVRDVAIEGLSAVAGHSADDVYLAALTGREYQAVRSAARALKGSPRGAEVTKAAIAAARRIREDSSETSRDTRMELLARISEMATPSDAATVAALATDFDCEVAKSATTTARKLGASLPAGDAPRCTPMKIKLPRDAVALALGMTVNLVVKLADSTGHAEFAVRLRGDVAPLMAARIIELASTGYYQNLTWHRVEPDFVIQGGSPGSNEYMGNPRYLRDELATLSHSRGTVGMSTRGHDTGDAQWFVNLKDNARLTRDYTIFGEVVQGIEVVDGILEGDVIARIDVARKP